MKVEAQFKVRQVKTINIFMEDEDWKTLIACLYALSTAPSGTINSGTAESFLRELLNKSGEQREPHEGGLREPKVEQ